MVDYFVDLLQLLLVLEPTTQNLPDGPDSLVVEGWLCLASFATCPAVISTPISVPVGIPVLVLVLALAGGQVGLLLWPLALKLLGLHEGSAGVVGAVAVAVVGLGDHHLLGEAEVGLHEAAALLGRVVVAAAAAVHVVVALEPLDELQVVLVLGPGDALHLNNGCGTSRCFLMPRRSKQDCRILRLAMNS